MKITAHSYFIVSPMQAQPQFYLGNKSLCIVKTWCIPLPSRTCAPYPHERSIWGLPQAASLRHKHIKRPPPTSSYLQWGLEVTKLAQFIYHCCRNVNLLCCSIQFSASHKHFLIKWLICPRLEFQKKEIYLHGSGPFTDWVNLIA